MTRVTKVNLTVPVHESTEVSVPNTDMDVKESKLQRTFEYSCRMTTRDAERALDLCFAAARNETMEFRDLLPDSLREEYTPLVLDMDVNVTPATDVLCLAARVKVGEQGYGSVFGTLRRWEQNENYLDEGTVRNAVDYYHDYGDHELGGINRKEAIRRLEEE